jgi:hypothetical protein
MKHPKTLGDAHVKDNLSSQGRVNDLPRPFLGIFQRSTTSVVASIADIRFLRAAAKVGCVPIIVLLVIAALGPAKWAPRTALGWQFDHFTGYFGITLYFCFAWARPFVVGGVFISIAALLEGLQALTPDRSAYLPAIFYGAAGALAAALVGELVIRVWRWRRSGMQRAH